MTLQKLLTSTFVCLLIGFTIPSKATHIMGADFEYNCLGGDTFEIVLDLYSHCDGIGLPTSQTIQFSSTCGQSFNTTATLVYDSLGNAYAEVSTLCDSLTTPCAQGLSPYIGIRHHQYVAIVVLSPPCDTWTMQWNTCCRSNTVNVPSSSSNQLLVDATINTASNPCNNSPTWNSHLAYTICASDTSYLDFSATDAEGDSLSYALVAAWDQLGLPVTYGGGFSATQPIPTSTLDPTTGIVCVVPSIVGNFIVVVEVTQYDSLGNVIGTIRRDIQVTVSNCSAGQSSQTPYNISGFTGLVGSVTQLAPTTLSTCAGENICFDFVVYDDDLADSLALTTQLQNYLPGATVSVTGINPMTINVCWTALPSPTGYWEFPIHVMDDHCPITQSNTFFGIIDMQGGVFASGNTTSCAGDPVQLTAQGSGGNYTWTSISGDPINVGINFSCDTCSTVIATPSTTTTYVVTGSATGSCPNADTITVVVDPGFTVTVLDSIHGLGCSDDSITILLTPSLTGTYTYDWTGTNLTSSGINSNSIVITASGQYDITYSITSAAGCTVGDTLTFSTYISPFFVNGDSAVCPYDSTGMALESGTGLYNGDWYDCNDSLLLSNSPFLSQYPPHINCYYVVYTDTTNNCVDTLYHNFAFHPTPTTGTVNGPTTVTAGDTATYYISGGTGTSYYWQVIGGTVYSGFGTDTIVVIWGSAQNGIIWAIAQDLSLPCHGSVSELITTIDEAPIGIEEPYAIEKFTLAPNPAGQFVNVIRDGSEHANIIITDISGKQLQTITSNEQLTEIDVSELASGVYFVTVQNADSAEAYTMKLLIE